MSNVLLCRVLSGKCGVRHAVWRQAVEGGRGASRFSPSATSAAYIPLRGGTAKATLSLPGRGGGHRLRRPRPSLGGGGRRPRAPRRRPPSPAPRTVLLPPSTTSGMRPPPPHALFRSIKHPVCVYHREICACHQRHARQHAQRHAQISTCAFLLMYLFWDRPSRQARR